MKPEELEKIKKQYDYCIIPTKNIALIEPTTPVSLPVIHLAAVSNNDQYMQFVNSDYFKVSDWGKL